MGRHLNKKNRKGLKVTGGVLASTLVLGGIGGGYLYWDINHRIQEKSVDIGVSAPEVEVVQPAEQPLSVPEFDGAFSLLLVGNDDGNGDAAYGYRDHALNDVNILLHVSEDHTKATAISVPRDMFVEVPTCTDPETGVVQPEISGVKINTALSRGGLKCVVDTFRELTGEKIDYAAMIQFKGVIALSNAVGGVPVCVSDDIDDPDAGLNLTAGDHTISGDQALAFLRTRHGVGDGSDLARISNQQVFMSSLMRTLKSKETLSDPKKVYEISNAVADNMTLSSNLASIPTLASLASSLKDIPLNDITFIQYPTAYADAFGLNGLLPKKDAAEEMIKAVFNDQSVVITGGTAPGSFGAIEEPKETPTTTPSITATPSPEVTDIPTASPSPSVTATETPVTLPSDVTGMTASQKTCSRAFGEY